MGIYIKGIEMPKDGEHPYWVVIHSDGIVEYNENKGQGWQTSEAVPTADMVEKKKGEWIEDGYYNEPCVCSYCGVSGNPVWNFCPNCGAEMREEVLSGTKE